MWWACLSALSLAFIGSSLTAASGPEQQVLGNGKSGSNSERQPNIVFILTDDQDVHLASLDYMPLVKKHLLDKGTYYNKHYCTTAVCCPSRVTLWTGKAAHNTNITDVNPPYGGYPRFVEEGLNENYLPVWLQQAGYNTYYTGKLFNVHTVTNYDSPFAAGFTSSDFQLDPHTYDYLNSTFQRNQEKPKSYEGQYVTDVLAEKAYRFLDEAVNAEKPFFLTVAPTAPHCNILMNGSILDKNPKFEFDAPIPAKRHEHLFEDVRVPRTEAFNPDVPSGVSWVQKLPQQNQSNIDYNDHFYRSRLRALQAVDELIDGLFSRLETYNLLENTYIIYSSDNGFHIGQHRLQPGKSCGFEEDINIPLIIRGPGVAENESTDIVTTHTDLAPTFLDLLGIPKRTDFDGSAFPVTKEGLLRARGTRGEHVNVEYWGFAGGEGKNNNFLHVNNTYKALRIIGPGYNLYYSVWCNNEHELYDMDNDPHQLLNLLPTTHTPITTPSTTSSSTIPTIPETLNLDITPKILNLPLSKLVPRLDSLLFVLKSCKNTTCVHPWKALHPKGDVTGLRDALEEKYDSFYEVQQQNRVWFQRCENGYLVDAEGDMFERDGLAWDVWV